MLKISEMAKLANTTRRTLIYYDQEGLFKPKEKNAAGYRYYDYNQLYDLLFILSLKKLGIPLTQVKQIVQQPDQLSVKQLSQIQSHLNHEADNLHRTQIAISQIIKNHQTHQKIQLQVPQIQFLPETFFWCSNQSASCTDKEVAEMFAKFYQELGPLAMVDSAKSGYLTNLQIDQDSDYPDAAFRVIKEINNTEPSGFPMIRKQDGQYATICVKNELASVQAGMRALNQFCQERQLQTDKYLWQINTNNRLNQRGASQTMWLEFLIKK